MKITNNHNLPWALVNAARRDTYSRGQSRKSVTQLINSPRIDILRDQHHGEMEADITDRIWALLGTAVHHILERGADESHTPEERLFATVKGWVISGQVDVQHDDPGIIDYKVTSVWSVMYDKPEWEYQLNSYAFLVREAKGINVNRLQICAILRDWKKSEADRDISYPQQPILMIDIPVWTAEEQRSYIESRVTIHQDAEVSSTFGDDLPECSDNERWVRDKKWAVFKPKGKRAFRILSNEEEATDLAKELGGTVEARGGEPIRCINNYCGVAAWCSQWKKELDAKSQMGHGDDAGG